MKPLPIPPEHTGDDYKFVYYRKFSGVPQYPIYTLSRRLSIIAFVPFRFVGDTRRVVISYATVTVTTDVVGFWRTT